MLLGETWEAWVDEHKWEDPIFPSSALLPSAKVCVLGLTERKCLCLILAIVRRYRHRRGATSDNVASRPDVPGGSVRLIVLLADSGNR